MTEVMPFLQKYDITFLRPPPRTGDFFLLGGSPQGIPPKEICGHSMHSLRSHTPLAEKCFLAQRSRTKKRIELFRCCGSEFYEVFYEVF